MKETRIYFSFENNKQYALVVIYLKENLKGFTIFESIGIWKEIIEQSKVIEIIHNTVELTTKRIREIANRIKEIANQESVLITTKEISSELI